MLGAKKIFQKFRKSCAGSVAPMFAGISLVLILGVGTAYDMHNASEVKAKLQSVVDVTVLAAVNDPSLDSPGLVRTANDWFAANGGLNPRGRGASGANVYGYVWRAGDFRWYRDSADDNDDDVKVVIWADVPTSFMGMFGRDSIRVEVEATASGQAGQEPFELAIVLDTTASMASFGGNWPRAVDAFTAMVETMDESAEDGVMDESTVAFIPFSDRVNVGSTNVHSWGKGPNGAGDCLHPRERTGANPDLPFMLDAASPHGAGKFWRTTTGTCPQQLSLPTHIPSDIAGDIATITPSGTGRFDVGLAWGWRMLSPNWRGQWGMGFDYPAPYEDKKKVIVMLTDGFSYIYEREVHTLGEPTQPWGWNNGTPEAFEHFEQLCTDIKATGIELHMVYLNGNKHFKPYMERCATSDDHFHEVDDISDLEDALENVAEVSSGFVLKH